MWKEILGLIYTTNHIGMFQAMDTSFIARDVYPFWPRTDAISPVAVVSRCIKWAKMGWFHLLLWYAAMGIQLLRSSHMDGLMGHLLLFSLR